jgi:hypothetical protein
MISLSRITKILLSACAVTFMFIGPACISSMESTPIIDYELKGDRRKAFDEIHERWMRDRYPDCMKKFKLSMNCSHCEDIYIMVRITIDARGRIKEYVKIREDICGGKADERLERCFMESLESITFPRSLRNMVIETRLGTGLKC